MTAPLGRGVDPAELLRPDLVEAHGDGAGLAAELRVDVAPLVRAGVPADAPPTCGPAWTVGLTTGDAVELAVTDGDGELELGELLGDGEGLVLCPGDVEVDGEAAVGFDRVQFVGLDVVRPGASGLNVEPGSPLVPWLPCEGPVPTPPGVEPGAFELLGKIACWASMAT